MYTLRQAIFDRLKEIGEERRALADERRVLLDRLQQLEQNVSGVDASSVIQTMNETVRALSDLVPQVPASVLIEEVAKRMEQNGQTAKVNEAPAPAAKANIEKTIQEEKAAAPTQRKKNYSTKEVTSFIISYLRNNGGKAKNSDIQKYLAEKYDCHYKDFSQTMWLIRKEEPRLQKGKQGYSVLVEDEVTKQRLKAVQ